MSHSHTATATPYQLLQDPDASRTIFGDCSDTSALNVVRIVLGVIGDDMGTILDTMQVAERYSSEVRAQGFSAYNSRHIALQALSVLQVWGFVARIGEEGHHYVWCRTDKPVRKLDMTAYESRRATLYARARLAEKKAAAA
jgi:hypothetical protein